MRGFTLFEILISIAILSIVMAMIYGAYASNVESIEQARENGQMQQKARIILDRMHRDMASAFIAKPTPGAAITLGMKGEDQEWDGMAADRIHFTALSHVMLNDRGLRTDLCEISYFLKEAPENGEMILYRRDDPIVDDDITDGKGAMELAGEIRGLNIGYRDRDGVEYDQWDTAAGPLAGRLPALITIRLTLKDARGKEQVFMTSVHPELAGFESF